MVTDRERTMALSLVHEERRALRAVRSGDVWEALRRTHRLCKAMRHAAASRRDVRTVWAA